MAINIKFDLAGNPEPPTIILATRDGNKLGQLDVKADSIELVDKLNDVSEISFTMHKYVDSELTPLWDKVVDFKLIYCKEWDMWFEIRVELDEETETIKTIFGTQLGQAELSQIMLYNIEINTEADIEREDYKRTILWDVIDPEASLLSRLLKDKAPHYSVVHVDSTIANIQRSFSFDGTSICDAFQEIAEEIGCLFIFNSDSGEGGKINRTISVYDLQQNCLNEDCKYRGEFADVCPECGSTNIKYGYGKDTLIFVTADELADGGIQLTSDTEAVKNCFKLEAGDDLMTATIRNCNPNGTDYIWRFSDDMKSDMPAELVEKIEAYDTLYQTYHSDYVSNLDTDLLNDYNELVSKYSVYDKEIQPITIPIKGYSALMNAYYNTIDLELYLKSGLMPSVEMSDTTAEEQARLLTNSLFLSTVGVANAKTVSVSTANSAVLAMAKVIVRPTYKIQVNTSELSTNKKTWTGNFTITNYSDEEDTVTSSTVSVNISGDLETYTRQLLEKELNKENTDDLSITGLFKKEYNPFCDELKKYALNPLIGFKDACQACIDILIKQGVADENGTWSDTESGSDANLYENLYLPYYRKLKAIEAEIKVRENEIAVISGVYDVDGNLKTNGLQASIEECRNSIQDTLNFEKYLGEDLWLIFCSYRREDKYPNDNYISDGLDNAELFKRALEFFDVAEKEIYKASELQLSISSDLKNLLAIKKFKPLVDYFEVGNWIRIQVDDYIYKLRLIEYAINFGDFNSIPVEFSDVTKVKNGITDVESILSQASSMASSYDSVQRQANQGNDANSTINQWLEEGLNSANVRIQNNTNEEVTMDKNGLLCRTYDDITEEYSPEQFKLTHNILAYTDDNWETVSAALGKHEYKEFDENGVLTNKVGYGLSSRFVTAGTITGSQIIGGDIYSDNYSRVNEEGSYINLRDGTFSFGGGALRFEGGKLLISSPDIPTTEQITEINENYLKTTNVYAQNLQVNSAKINGKLTAEQIDASELKVDAANITGSLTVGQLPDNVATEDDILTEDGVTTIVNGYIDTLELTARYLRGENVSLLTTDKSEAGTMSITGSSSSDYAVDLTSGGALRFTANNGHVFIESKLKYGSDNTYIELKNNGVITIKGNLFPYQQGANDIGGGSLNPANPAYWRHIYCYSVTQVSDRNKKKDFVYNLDKYDGFFNDLQPVGYKFKDENIDKSTHLGLIAQDVEQSLINNNLLTSNFAGLIKTPIGNEEYDYALVYSEFISLCIDQIQKLKKRVDELEAKING